MQALLIILALLKTNTYTLHGDKIKHTSEAPSCGAAERLLADTYKIEITGSKAKINYTDWDVLFTSDELYILVAGKQNEFTQYYMIFDPKEHNAELTLDSITEDRRPCRDTITLH